MVRKFLHKVFKIAPVKWLLKPIYLKQLFKVIDRYESVLNKWFLSAVGLMNEAIRIWFYCKHRVIQYLLKKCMTINYLHWYINYGIKVTSIFKNDFKLK